MTSYGWYIPGINHDYKLSAVSRCRRRRDAGPGGDRTHEPPRSSRPSASPGGPRSAFRPTPPPPACGASRAWRAERRRRVHAGSVGTHDDAWAVPGAARDDTSAAMQTMGAFIVPFFEV